MDREEALKKVRQMSLPKETIEILEALAPELAESEDEKIRKTLIHIVKGACDKYGIKYRGDDITEEKLLVYLEKQKEQKEQKPVPPLPPFDEMTPEDKMNHPLYLEGFDTGREVQKVFDEQEPAEWSEEEKEILDNILSHYVLIDKPIDANGIPKEKYISLIKSIRFDTYKNCNSHWKPSKEQMRALNEIVNILAESPFLHQNDYLFNILNGLREELKKLL